MIPTEFTVALEQLIHSTNRVLFLGIGENRMSDDGFGQYVSFHLRQLVKKMKIPKKVKIINGKTDYVERKNEIFEFRPDILLLLDTCQPNNSLQVTPGILQLHDESDFINWLPLSSHVLPIPVFISELKFSLPNLKSALIGIVPVSTDYTEEVLQYKPDIYSLDDYESDPDLPFYEFNLTPKIQKIADQLVDYLLEILKN